MSTNPIAQPDLLNAARAVVNDLQGLAFAEYGSLEMAHDYSPNLGKLIGAIANTESEVAALRSLLASAKAYLEEHQDTATGQSGALRNLIAAISPPPNKNAPQ